MGMTDKSLCDSCTNIGCEFQSGIVRTKCAFYMPPQLEPDNCGNYVVQEPTTKNDLGVDWESYKDVDGNSLDDLILEVLQNYFDCGNTYGYKVADEIIGLLPSVTPQEPRWIPMVRREPTDEEKAEYLAQNGEELCYMLENEMPLNGQEVLVSIGEFVSEDIFDEDFYNFENNDVENVDAWMPLPKPYGLESEDKE